jgi:predicted DNA-binding protein (UPF0251 family)
LWQDPKNKEIAKAGCAAKFLSRLCDLQGLFQEQAGEKMGVSRGTVQRLLASAHRKVAEALTEGAALVMGDEDD